LRAEELVALASVHGVDLVRAARLSARRSRGLTRRRGTNGHSYEELIEPSAQRANGRASRSFQRRSWTLAEFGQVAAGVREVPYLAASYSFAGDTSGYWKLWSALESAAQELRVRHSWPIQVKSPTGPRFYLEQLAQLVLDEDAHGYLFANVPALYWIYTGVDKRTWERGVAERFGALQLRFQGWIGEAMHVMQPRLEELAAEE
jgi:hypothetical protein